MSAAHRTLDTPEHAAYRAGMLAYEASDHDPQVIELHSLREEVTDLRGWIESHVCECPTHVHD